MVLKYKGIGFGDSIPAHSSGILMKLEDLLILKWIDFMAILLMAAYLILIFDVVADPADPISGLVGIPANSPRTK